VTLKTGVMMLKIQLCIINFKIVIIFDYIIVFTVSVVKLMQPWHK